MDEERKLESEREEKREKLSQIEDSTPLTPRLKFGQSLDNSPTPAPLCYSNYVNTIIHSNMKPAYQYM